MISLGGVFLVFAFFGLGVGVLDFCTFGFSFPFGFPSSFDFGWVSGWSSWCITSFNSISSIATRFSKAVIRSASGSNYGVVAKSFKLPSDLDSFVFGIRELLLSK